MLQYGKFHHAHHGSPSSVHLRSMSNSPVGTTGDDAATEGLPVVRRLPFAPEGLEAYPKPNNRVKFVEGRAALSKTPALGYFNDLECFNPHWFCAREECRSWKGGKSL